MQEVFIGSTKVVGEIPKEYYRTGKKFIVKVQRPLSTFNVQPEALIYSESRDWELYMPYNKEDWLFVFPNNEPKTYWKAYFSKEGLVIFDKRVKEQTW